MINHPNFNKAECLARELRLLQPNNLLSFDIRKMYFDRNIRFDTFRDYAITTNIPVSAISNEYADGYTIRLPQNNNLILYSDNAKSEKRLKWTLAHEIGHIYMGHTCDSNLAEVEANWFAAELLMPIPILFEMVKVMKTVTADALVDLFGVSHQAAIKKISSIKRMKRVSYYLWDDLIEKYEKEIKLYTVPTELGLALAY